ncbi:hypothetical protein [Legionella sp. 29fVS95]|uniref:hypothetical protein n=1 Tax=Legionella sp. 29fVS95 TaxID=3402813 RepID=UPI003AF42063
MSYTEANTPITLPTSQQWLLEFLRILGYEPGDNDKKPGDAPYLGLCCGIAHLGAPAVLGGDIEPFKQRFYRIYALLTKLKKENTLGIEHQYEPDYLTFLSVSEKNEKRPQDANNESLRDIQAFCDNVVLYQFLPLFEKIFGTSRSWSELIPFLFSPKIEALGGIEKPIENFQQCLTRTELIHYFKTLRAHLENANPSPITQSLSLVLSSLEPDGNGIHSINVSFHQGKWRLIDANYLELINAEFASDEDIAAQVMQALGSNVQEYWDENSKLTMLTETYVIGTFLDTFAPPLTSWKSDIMKMASSTGDDTAFDIDAFMASLLNSGSDLSVQSANSDPAVQPVMLELVPDREYPTVTTAENYCVPPVTSEPSHVSDEESINQSKVFFASSETVSAQGLVQGEQDETSYGFFYPGNETPVEAVSNAEEAAEIVPRCKRKVDATEREKERAEEEQEFSSRKRRLMYEDSESYRFFVPSMQEDSLCIPEIGTGGEYEYQC